MSPPSKSENWSTIGTLGHEGALYRSPRGQGSHLLAREQSSRHSSRGCALNEGSAEEALRLDAEDGCDLASGPSMKAAPKRRCDVGQAAPLDLTIDPQ